MSCRSSETASPTRPRTVRIGSNLAALEPIRGGVATIADMYRFEPQVGRVCDRTGIRRLVGQTLADLDPPDAPDPMDIPSMERVAARSDAHPDRPHQLRLAEMVSETDWAARTHGSSPIETVRRGGLPKPGLICAHGRFVSETAMDHMATAQVTVARNARLHVRASRGISTDSPMSDSTLDHFWQVALVTMFVRLRGRSRKPIPAHEVIRMAAIDRARARPRCASGFTRTRQAGRPD